MNEPARPRGARLVHRRTSRVVPVADDGRVLLLHGHEPARPDWWFWFTIGGAVEAGESVRAAACRELFEEVGISVPEASLGEPYLSEEIEFDWDDAHIIQHQTFFAVLLPDAPLPDLSALDGQESQTIDQAAWVDPADLASGEAEPVNQNLVTYVRAAVTQVLGPDFASS